MSKETSGQHGPLSERTPREDPGMSKGSSGQFGSLCLKRHEGRIPGCLKKPLDSTGPLFDRTPKEDPGMSKGSSGQYGNLCLKGT